MATNARRLCLIKQSMAIIQIPLKDPEPSERAPERPAAPVSEQLSFEGAFYDARGWEDAYRDLHSAPALLIQAKDDLARSRQREAFWISVVFHLVAIVFLLLSPKFEKWFPHRQVLLVQNPHQQAIPLFLDLPPDAQKIPKPPHTNIQSDKDRMAMSRHPQIDAKQLHDLLGTKPAGTSAPPAPPAAKAQPATPPPTQAPPAQAQQQQQPQRSTPPPTTNQTAKLQTPPLSPKDVFGGPMSAGSTIEEATRAAAANRGGYGGSGGDYGLGQGRQPAALGPMEILSDTQGIDFGPYLARVLHDVRENWYTLIPEVARPPLMKKGNLTIQFAIMRDGSVQGLTLVRTSGDNALDRAAWGGITNSNPFPTLPSQFTGQYLALRFHFFYNPDKNDMQ